MKHLGVLWMFIAIAIYRPMYGVAQNGDSFDYDKSKKEMNARFDAFRRLSKDEFERKRGELNKEYSDALSQIWSLREPEDPLELPGDIPVPFPQAPGDDTDTVTLRIPDRIISPDKKIDPLSLIPLVRSSDSSNIKEKAATLRFFGVDCYFSRFPTVNVRLEGVDERNVSKVWNSLLHQRFYDLVSECLYWKNQLNLNDWGYYLLVKYVSEKTITDKFPYQEGLRTILTHFILNQSGYGSTLGRNDHGLQILLPVLQTLYGYPFVKLNGVNYYVIAHNMKYSALRVFDRMPGRGKNIDISFSTYPELGNTEVTQKIYLNANQKEVTLRLNKELKDYLSEFPVTDEWDIYVRASLSPGLKKQLYPLLGKLMERCGASESLDRLLKFIQTTFDYKTDTEQFGHERPFFGDESFFYQYNDCEDRAILFCIIAKELLGRTPVLLQFPGHLAAAVKLEAEDKVSGDILRLDDGDYLICDPTYIGAQAGMCMPQFRDTKCYVMRI